MPLTRDHMTKASRIMLPTYVVVFAWLGFNYLLTPTARLAQSPALQFANTVLPLHALGILLLGASGLMLHALHAHRRPVSRYALILAGICFAILFFIFGASTLFNDASPSAAAWPFLGTAACVASYRSVTVYEAD